MPIAPTPPQFSTVRSQPRQRSSQECRLRRRGTGSVRDGENQARISRRGSNLSVSGALQVEEIREHAQYFRFLRGERRNRGLGGGEGGIRTPETLSSLHAFQACALNRARPPLRARTPIMHHARPRNQFVRINEAGMLQRRDENAPGSESGSPIFFADSSHRRSLAAQSANGCFMNASASAGAKGPP